MNIMRALFVGVTVCCGLAVTSANAQQAQDARDARDRQRCERNAYNCQDTPNPLPAFDSVWIEELTWMEVRDALAAGRTTVIIPTGGVEENGPWIATGKHTYILQATCDAIARKLGNALCAPIVKLAPARDFGWGLKRSRSTPKGTTLRLSTGASLWVWRAMTSLVEVTASAKRRLAAMSPACHLDFRGKSKTSLPHTDSTVGWKPASLASVP